MAPRSAVSHLGLRSPRTPVPADVRFVLEVVHGVTEHPQRPLPKGRLSIGSGKKCWLRLGGDGMPDIHSWLEVTSREIELFVFQEHPRVQVNGKAVRFAVIRGGESLMIGPYEFRIRAERSVTSPARTGFPHLSPDQLAILNRSLARPVAEMSAEQLIDAIDDDLQLIDRSESRQRAGWKNLLNAVRDAGAQEDARAPIPLEQAAEYVPAHEAAEQEDAVLVGELNRMLRQVEELTVSLQQRADQLQQREAGYEQAAGTLLDAQHKIVEQMEALIQSLDKSRTEPPQKAIA